MDDWWHWIADTRKHLNLEGCDVYSANKCVYVNGIGNLSRITLGYAYKHFTAHQIGFNIDNQHKLKAHVLLLCKDTDWNKWNPIKLQVIWTVHSFGDTRKSRSQDFSIFQGTSCKEIVHWDWSDFTNLTDSSWKPWTFHTFSQTFSHQFHPISSPFISLEETRATWQRRKML